MILAMEKRKTRGRPNRPDGTKDTAVRLSQEMDDRFMAQLQKMEPVPSKSAMVAVLIKRWVEEQERGAK